MKRKLTIVFSCVALLFGIVTFILFGKFIFFDCADLIKAGCSKEICLGFSLVAFYFIGFSLPEAIFDFVKLCKSSGSPDDK